MCIRDRSLTGVYTYQVMNFEQNVTDAGFSFADNLKGAYHNYTIDDWKRLSWKRLPKK